MTHDPSSTAALSGVLADVFSHGRPDTRAALAMAANVRRFDAEQTFIRQGDRSFVGLILEGHAAVRRTTVDGRQLMVMIVTRGQLVPILPLAARPAGADVVTLTPSAAALWRAEELRAFATADPGLAIDILDQVLDMVEGVGPRLDSLHYQNGLRRVARVLHFQADLFFADPPVLTRTHLPTLVGTSREMTGRMIRVLESKGVVTRVGRDRLRLLDPPGLAMAAGSGTERPRMDRRTSS